MEARTLIMDATIFLILVQKAVVAAAVYALLALAFVLVFTVTRIIFVPQGELVSFAALTLVALESHQVPQSVWLLLGLGLIAFLFESYAALRKRQLRRIAVAALMYLIVPLAISGSAVWASGHDLPIAVLGLVSVLVIVPIGPMLYRVVFQGLVDASVLMLLVVAVAVHFVLNGGGLILFGPEGARSKPFLDGVVNLGPTTLSLQNLAIVAAALALAATLAVLFGRTLYGKLLRATAMHRMGARLVGIDPIQSGLIVFGLTALIGATTGVLMSPNTTMYYDTGFLIGLKGLIAGAVGGLISYPLAAVGAILVALLEVFGAFKASAFKEIIVFTLIVPVLIWRSVFRGKGETHSAEEDGI